MAKSSTILPLPPHHFPIQHPEEILCNHVHTCIPMSIHTQCLNTWGAYTCVIDKRPSPTCATYRPSQPQLPIETFRVLTRRRCWDRLSPWFVHLACACAANKPVSHAQAWPNMKRLTCMHTQRPTYQLSIGLCVFAGRTALSNAHKAA